MRRASFWVGNSNTVDTVYVYDDYTLEDNGYLKDMKGCATCTEIKEWIKSEYSLKVSSLYAAQIKNKCGIEKRLNYNLGDNKSRVPKYPPEKEKAIMEAFEHFNMISINEQIQKNAQNYATNANTFARGICFLPH